MSGGWLGAFQRARLAGHVVQSVVQSNPGSPQNAHGAGFTSRGERPGLSGVIQRVSVEASRR